MSDAQQAAFKIKLHDCKLLVRKVKLSPSIYLAHAKGLEVGNARYPIKRVLTKSFTIPRGNLDFTQENIFSGQLPSRLVIGLVDNDAFNGAYEKNPFNFKHYGLTQIKVFLDGHSQYIRPISANFAAHNSIEAYMSLFNSTNKNQKDEGNDISREEYSRGFTLYGFDLSPDLSEGDHFNLVREGNVRLELKFSAAMPNTVNAIVYSEFENVLEIDRTRNIIYDFGG